MSLLLSTPYSFAAQDGHGAYYHEAQKHDGLTQASCQINVQITVGPPRPTIFSVTELIFTIFHRLSSLSLFSRARPYLRDLASADDSLVFKFSHLTRVDL
jgi:hypothetical protein